MNFLFIVYHENYNKCYCFMDTCELATFPFDTKLVLCRGKHLCIPSLKIQPVRKKTNECSHNMYWQFDDSKKK